MVAEQKNKKRKTTMKEEEKTKKTVCVCIDVELWRKVKACAAIEGRKMAEMVEKALKDEIRMKEVQNA
jgi:hypothetical protein